MYHFSETEVMPPFMLYRCKGGCIHLLWGNTMLRFSSLQFAFFIKAINEAYQQIEQSGTKGETNAQHAINEPIM